MNIRNFFPRLSAISAKAVTFLSVAILGVMMAHKPASAAPAGFCHAYADAAVFQFKRNLNRGCGFAGPRWHNWRKGHYQWCRAVPKGLARMERAGRRSKLAQCGGGGPICRIKKRFGNTIRQATRRARRYIRNNCRVNRSTIRSVVRINGQYRAKIRCCR